MEKKHHLSQRAYKEACFQIDKEVARFRSSSDTTNGRYISPVMVPSPAKRVATSLIERKNWSLYGKAAAINNYDPVFGVAALATDAPLLAANWNTVRPDVTEEEITLLKDLLKKETEVYNKTVAEMENLNVKINHIVSSTKLRIANAVTIEELDKIMVDFRETLGSL